MSRRPDDFDASCDPDHPKILQMKDVYKAREQIESNIIRTPCVPSHYQKEFVMHLYYKLEILQKSGSFKERGVLNALLLMPRDKQKIGVVVASLGNAAVGMCIYALKLRIPVIVVMPTCVSTAKLQRCYSLGAKVIVQGGNLMEAHRYARAIAKDKGLTYINGRDHPHLLAGYGTLTLEILEQLPFVDAVIVPVGCGGLLASVATVIKNLKPSCLVYGVEPAGMPVFNKSLENGEPWSVPLEHCIADVVAVTHVGVNSFNTAAKLIDKMLLVNDSCISRAMLHLVEKERLVVEGAGACSLGAVMGNLVPELKLKHVVCILSGGNIDPIFFPRCLERGLASEGRLIKFKVGIKEGSTALAELLKLLVDGGYNLVRQFQQHRWFENDVYRVEMRLVCEARNIQHGLELKKIIEREYSYTVFETEPFNDKRSCPCVVRKFMLFP